METVMIFKRGIKVISVIVTITLLTEQMSWAFGPRMFKLLGELSGIGPGEDNGVKMINAINRSMDEIIAEKNQKAQLKKEMEESSNKGIKGNKGDGVVTGTATAAEASGVVNTPGNTPSGIKNAEMDIRLSGDGYIFAGGRVTDNTSSGDIEYTLGANGDITALTDKTTGESYVADPSDVDGTITFIQDSTGVTRTYRDNALIKISDPAGMTVEYVYDSEKRTSRSVLSYLGKVYEQYNYTYINGFVSVSDIGGNERTFDKDNRLISRDMAGGYRYVYAYTKGPDGSQIMTEKFDGRVLQDGTLIKYSAGHVTGSSRLVKSGVNTEMRTCEGYDEITINNNISVIIIDNKAAGFRVGDKIVEIRGLENVGKLRKIFDGGGYMWGARLPLLTTQELNALKELFPDITGIMKKDLSITAGNLAAGPIPLLTVGMSDKLSLVRETEKLVTSADFYVKTAYNANNVKLYASRADGISVTYNSDGTVANIKDTAGNIIEKYQYTAENGLDTITMAKDRGKVGSFIDSAVNVMRGKVSAIRKGILDEYNRLKVDFMAPVTVIKNNFDAERARLESCQTQRIKHNTFGFIWYETVSVPGSAEALAQLAAEEAEYDRGVAAQLDLLTGEKDSKIAELKTAEDGAVKEYELERGRMLLAIKRQETASLAVYHYEKYLGRAPSKDEIEAIDLRAAGGEDITGTKLAAELKGSNEYKNYQNFRRNVTRNVKGYLEEVYTGINISEKLKTDIGIAESEVVDLSFEFIEDVTKWLESREEHFGRSAFGAIDDVLKVNGKTVPREEIAAKALLIEILTGRINIFTEGKLEISMRGMEQVFSLYGIERHSAKVSYADIQNAKSGSNVMINDNHYVTVISATDKEVTYLDGSIGEEGNKVIIKREDFELRWTGQAILEVVPGKAKAYSAMEAGCIKGSGFFIIPVIAAVVSVLTTVITAALSAVVLVPAYVIGMIGQIGAALISSIASLTTGLAAAGKALITGLGVGSLFGSMTTGATAVTLTHGAANFAIKTAVSYASEQALRYLGVDPIVGSVISSVITGGAHGALANKGIETTLRSAMEFGAYTSANLIAKANKLNPAIMSIIANTGTLLKSAVMANGIPKPADIINLSYLATGGVVSYTMKMTTEALELSPDISCFMDVTIKAVLEAGTASGNLPEDLFDKIISNLVMEIPRIVIKQVMDKAKLPAIVKEITSSILYKMSEGLVQDGMNMFREISESYRNNTFGIGPEPSRFSGKYWSTDPYSGEREFNEALYINDKADWSLRAERYKENSVDLTAVIMRDGMVRAINDNSGKIFDETTVRALDTGGDGIGGYFRDKIAKKEFELHTWNGKQYAKVKMIGIDGRDHGNAYFGYLSDGPGWVDLAGIEKDGNFVIGDVYVDPDSFIKLKTGDMMKKTGTYYEMQTVKDFEQKSVEIKDNSDKVLFTLTPGNNGGLRIDENGNLVSGIACSGDMRVNMNDGTAEDFWFNKITAEGFAAAKKDGWFEADSNARYRVSYQMNNRGQMELIYRSPVYEPGYARLDNIPINKDPEDNGVKWQNEFGTFQEVTAGDIVKKLDAIFGVFGDYNPYDHIKDSAPTLEEKLMGFAGDSIANYLGNAMSGSASLPGWLIKLGGQLTNELSSIGENPADVRMYKKDLAGLKEIYDIISEELGPGTVLCNDTPWRFEYDKITAVDAKDGNLAFSIEDILLNKFLGPTVEAYNNFTGHRNQFYDATQKDYRVSFDYRLKGEVNRRTIQLNVRLGQYIDPLGCRTYGIIYSEIIVKEFIKIKNNSYWKTINERRIP